MPFVKPVEHQRREEEEQDILQKKMSRRDAIKYMAVAGALLGGAYGVLSAIERFRGRERPIEADKNGHLINTLPSRFEISPEGINRDSSRNDYSVKEGSRLVFSQNGQNFEANLHYSDKIFSTVSWMYAEGRAPEGDKCNGDIAQSVYRLPDSMKGHKVSLVNSVFGVNRESNDYNLNPDQKYYLVPIVAEGHPYRSLVPGGYDNQGLPIPRQNLGAWSVEEGAEVGFDIVPTDRGMKYNQGHYDFYLMELETDSQGEACLSALGIIPHSHSTGERDRLYMSSEVLADEMRNVSYDNALAEAVSVLTMDN